MCWDHFIEAEAPARKKTQHVRPAQVTREVHVPSPVPEPSYQPSPTDTPALVEASS